MTIDFRIRSGTESESEAEEGGSGIAGAAAAATTKQGVKTERVVLGRAPDEFIATVCSAQTGGDFSTLIFSDVYRLFREAVFNLEQTALVVNRLVCHAAAPNEFRFSDGAMRVLTEENAGGASEFSEAVSYELFHRLFNAQLEKTEMSIAYQWGAWSRKTDYTVCLGGRKVAVSVTRAMRFRGIFTETDAFKLLYKKLAGVQLSNRDVLAGDRWTKQVLHILTEHVYIVDLLRSTYAWMYEKTPELIGNTVVLITLTAGTPFLYYNFMSQQRTMKFVHTETSSTAASVQLEASNVAAAVLKDTCSASRFSGAQSVDEAHVFKTEFGQKEEAMRAGGIPIEDEKDNKYGKDEAARIFEVEGKLAAKEIWDSLEGAVVETWQPKSLAAKEVSRINKTPRGGKDLLSFSYEEEYMRPLQFDHQPLEIWLCDMELPCLLQQEGALQPSEEGFTSAQLQSPPSIIHAPPSTSTANVMSHPTDEQRQFPPEREWLLAEFQRTFRCELLGQRTVSEVMKRAHSYVARCTPVHEFVAWSFIGADFAEEETIGLDLMFDEAQTD